MPSGVEVARAYVTIIPKSDGTSSEVISSVVDPLQDSVSEAGDKAGGLFNLNLGKMLGKFAVPAAIGTALVGIGKIGSDMYAEVESGMMNVITATGATGDAAKELEDVYKGVASNVVGSFEDIGSAVGEVNTRFGINGDDLQSLSEQYMKFAKVNGTDVVNSIDQTQKVLTAFGKTADDAPALLDAMTKAGQNTGVSMETLQNGLVQNAAALQEMGLNVDQSVGFLADLEMTGANSSTVMSGLRKAMKNAAADGVPLDDALAQLQDSIQNGTDGMDGLTAAYDLFGRNGDAVYAAVKNGSLDFKSLSEAAADTSGTLDEVYQNTLTNSEKMDLAMQNIKIAGADLFAPIATSISDALTNVVIPLAQEAGEKVGAFMEGVTTFYDNNIRPVVQNVESVVMPVVESVVDAVETGIDKVGDVVNDVMPKVQAVVQTVWPYVQQIIVTVANVLKTVLPPIFNTIWKVIQTVMNSIRSIVQTVWPVVRNIITTAANGIKTTISGISSVISSVRSTFESIKTAMTNPIETARNTIKGIIDKVKGFFPLSIGNIFSNLRIPHISIYGGSAPFGIGGFGTPPSISVQWYAKGGIVDAPTLIGAGEAGPEAVVPLSGKYMRPFAEAIAKELDHSGDVHNTFNIYQQPGEDPQALAERVVRIMTRNERSKSAVWGTT